jgi:SAM-dependent methyltransferase
MTFKDYFSGHASEYAKYRPTYPTSLFAYLASLSLAHELAWDCATGNGQAALGLVPYYKKIIATDASAQQIQSAQLHPQIRYQVMPAEKTIITEQSIDLICVAQALHWFNLEAFYKEVERVLKPSGILAAWTYTLVETNNAEINKIIHTLYWNITQGYWAPERRFVDEEYKTIPFPFRTITTPKFFMETQWNLTQLIGYLNTWSGVKNYMNKRGQNPIELIEQQLSQAWGNSEQTQLIRWPLHVLIGLAAASNHDGLPVAPL